MRLDLEAVSRDRAAVLTRINVSRETRDRLDQFVALFLRWQARFNLVAPSTLPEIWSRHLADGLRLHALAPKPCVWCDLGSGGGMPGIVLAILLAESGGSIDLVESNSKKAAFLRTAARELKVPARVHAVRIEATAPVLAAADIITARAVADLEQLLEWVAPHTKSGAVCLFPKGRDHEREIANASAVFRYDLVKHDAGTVDGSVILQLSDIQRA